MPDSPTLKKKTPPKKRRESSGRGFKVFSLLLSLGVIGVIGGIAWAFLPVSSSAKTVTVEIPNRASGREIAAKLREEGVIRSEHAFLLMARLLGESAQMQAGDYELAPRMTLAQIITVLVRGEGLARWVTIPEGYTLKQVAAALGEKDLGDPRRIERIARAGGKSFKGLSFDPPANLEGYLFPDTYKLRRKATERQIIETMLENFDTKVAKPLKGNFQKMQAKGRSMRAIIILASMVEREARVKKEQAIIAGVLMNRLNIGMRLQVDATVQYALDAPKRRLLYKDLEIASPYNTYRIDGLPPGPICNPGLDAIKAALNPAPVKSIYYVARPDGTHIFSRTFEEHQAARVKARQLAKKAP